MLLTETDRAELLPTVTLPKFREEGFSAREAVAGGGGAGATALKLTETVGLLASLLMARLPDILPGL